MKIVSAGVLISKSKFKDMSKSNKNPNKERASRVHLENIEAGVIERTRDKTFMEKNYVLRGFLLLILIPVIGYSILTGTIFLYSYFLKTLGSTIGAAFAAVVFVSVVESIYFYFTYAVIVDFTDGDWKEVGFYNKLFTLKVAFMLTAGFCSVFWSIKGAPEMSDFLTRERSPIALIDEKPINDRYDRLIAAEDEAVALAGKMTWKKNIVEDGRKIIKKATENKQQYELARERELAEVRAKNTGTTLSYEKGITKRGNWYQGFAGAGQFLGFLIVLFLRIFDLGVRAELPEENENGIHEPDSSDQSGPSPSGGSVSKVENVPVQTEGSIPPGERRPIGYFLPNDDKPEMPVAKTGMNQGEPTQVANQPKLMSGQGATRLNQVEPTRNETQVTTQVGKVVLIGKNLVFEHTTEEGQIIHYDKTSVTGRYKKYAGKVDESAKNLVRANKNKDARMVAIHEKALDNRMRWMEYWQTALDLLDN